RLAWLPIPALIFTIAVLNIAVEPSVFYDPPWLIPITNTLFIAAICLAVAYIALRNYRGSGRIHILLLGCGVLIFGIGGALAGFVRGFPDGANLNVTIYNTGALAGALFHCVAAFILIAGISPEAGSRQKGLWLTSGYLGSIIFMAILTAATFRGLIPPFFIQEVGPTPLRQAILGTADVLFAFSFLVFLATYLRNRESFLYWYSFALALTSISLTAFFIQHSVGSPVGWTGRLSQYLGGAYFLVALVTAIREAEARRMSFDNIITASLTPAEERFRALAENSPDVIERFDKELKHVYINPAGLRLHGKPATSIIGRTIGEADLPEPYVEIWNERIRKVFETGESLEVEDYFPAANGPIFYQSRCVPEYGSDGKVAYVLVISRDITSIRKAQILTERQQTRIEAVNRILHSGLTAATEEALGETCLAVALEITGSTFGFIGEVGPDGLFHDIAISETGWELCAMYDRTGKHRSPGDFQVHGIYGKVIRDGAALFTNDPPSHPDSIGTPAGHPPLTSFLGTPLFREGRTIGMIAVGNRDGGYSDEQQESLESLAPAIVEAFMRKRAENKVLQLNRELQQRVAELQTIFNTVPIGMAITNAHGGNILANRAFEGIWGEPRPATSSVSDYHAYKAWWAETDRQVLPDEWASSRATRRGETVIGQLMRIRRFDGSHAFVHNSAAPIPDESGRIMGSVVAIMDITERMQAEEALRLAHDELEKRVSERTGELARAVEALQAEIAERRKLEQQLLHSQKMESIGVLAGGVAHDFNNMLNAIYGYGEIIRDNVTGYDELVKDSIDQVLKAAARAAELTRGLLAFSRKQVTNPKPVYIDDVIANTGKIIRRVIGEDIEFVTEFLDRELLVMADTGQMEQVLMNLTTNARDAMPNGGRLSISACRTEVENGAETLYDLQAPGGYALISVADTGTGIEGDSLGKLFDPFYTTKEVGRGTGLGLSIVYGIVKQHNGSVLVISEPGKGTAVNIRLPLIEGTAAEEEEKTADPLDGGTETLLLAEDEEIVRSLLKTILERSGYRVILAADGKEAVAKFREHDDISLVLSDMIMPGKNGREILEEIRSIKPRIGVIFISGYSADILPKKGIREEGIEFITKPVRKDELLRKIREVLDRV
ncbi:MAG TPA: PAS domain S-box protein, partial [Geobacteraceae bacterium]|nr:PAS domain S-box protein [Geobacteraceae bacterium]